MLTPENFLDTFYFSYDALKSEAQSLKGGSTTSKGSADQITTQNARSRKYAAQGQNANAADFQKSTSAHMKAHKSQLSNISEASCDEWTPGDPKAELQSPN